MTSPPESLVDRIARHAPVEARVRLRLPRLDWRLTSALTALLALGPLVTIVGADILRGQVGRESDALRAQGAVRFAAERAQREAATELRDAVRAPPMSVTLDRIAEALPDDARLVSILRGADGVLQVQIRTQDPDQLRATLRRAAMFAAMQEIGQRRTADARVIVTLRARR